MNEQKLNPTTEKQMGERRAMDHQTALQRDKSSRGGDLSDLQVERSLRTREARKEKSTSEASSDLSSTGFSNDVREEIKQSVKRSLSRSQTTENKTEQSTTLEKKPRQQLRLMRPVGLKKFLSKFAGPLFSSKYSIMDTLTRIMDKIANFLSRWHKRIVSSLTKRHQIKVQMRKDQSAHAVILQEKERKRKEAAEEERRLKEKLQLAKRA